MISTKNLCFFIIILLIGCRENKNDSVPVIREKVNKQPVVTYIIPMGNPKLDRKFGVEIFETPSTFKYLLMMYYDGTEQQDTLKIPDIGVWPVITVKQGADSLSCIIGFLDKEKVFREYKMLTASNNQLRLITLKKYSLGAN